MRAASSNPGLLSSLWLMITRDKKGPPLCAQLLGIPVLDDNFHQEGPGTKQQISLPGLVCLAIAPKPRVSAPTPPVLGPQNINNTLY